MSNNDDNINQNNKTSRWYTLFQKIWNKTERVSRKSNNRNSLIFILGAFCSCTHTYMWHLIWYYISLNEMLFFWFGLVLCSFCFVRLRKYHFFSFIFISFLFEVKNKAKKIQCAMTRSFITTTNISLFFALLLKMIPEIVFWFFTVPSSNRKYKPN